jgi:hypothetical protein
MEQESFGHASVRALTGTGRTRRRVIAVALSGALALGGAMAQPAEAAVKAKVDIPWPSGTAVAQPYPVGAKGAAIRVNYDWMATEDGKSWFDVALPDDASSGDLVVAAVSGSNAYVPYNGDGGQNDRGRVGLTKGAKAVKVTLPANAWDYVYLSDEGSQTRLSYQPFGGVATTLDLIEGGGIDPSYVDGCRVAWRVTSWEGDPPRTVLYDTCAGTALASFDNAGLRIAGYSASAKAVVHTGYTDDDKTKVCLRPLSGGGDACVQGSFGVAGAAEAGVLTRPSDSPEPVTYSFRDIAAKKVAWTFTGACGVADGRIACADDSGAIYRIDAKGSRTKLGQLPAVKAWGRIALGGDDVVLASPVGATVSRLQPDGKKAAKPTQLAAKGRDVVASGARAVVGDTLLDRGKVKKRSFLPSRATAGSVSGPYVAYWDPAKEREQVKRSDGKILLTTTDGVKGLFGSRALIQSAGALKVRDVETGKTIASLPAKDVRPVGLWGETVYYTRYDERNERTELFVWDYVGDPKGAKAKKAKAPAFEGGSGYVTDGALVVGNLVLDPATGKGTTIRGAAIVQNNRLAYSLESSRPDKVRVETLDFGGRSAPRMLGVIAKSSIKSGDKWTPEIDFSKPLLKGTLEIRDSKKKLVATVKLPATADGSYRGVGWNGKDAKGVPVAAGTYTWTVKATDDPVRTGLKKGQAAKALDGKSAASGKITVSLKSLKKSSTPKVSGAAKVGKTLKAKPGSWSPKPKFSYQWLRNGKKIKGATKSSYQLVSADKGKKISVKVKGAKAGYKAVTKTSKATSKVK